MKTLTMISRLFLVALVLVSFTSCKDIAHTPAPNQTCFPYEGRPSQTISYKEMASMLRKYKNTREGVLKNALGFEDTREVWFQIDSLKKYIAYIEKKSKESGVKITGINIMSSVYPKDPIFGNQQGYQTLILNPTTKKGNDNTVSFDPLYSENGTPAYLSDLLTPYFNELDSLEAQGVDLKKYIANFKANMETETLPSSGFNRGTNTPPN